MIYSGYSWHPGARRYPTGCSRPYHHNVGTTSFMAMFKTDDKFQVVHSHQSHRLQKPES